MNFLVVVCGLILLYSPRSFSFIQNDNWFVWWQRKISATGVGSSIPVLGLAVTLGLPVAVIAGLLLTLEEVGLGLSYVGINIFVLLYAFGRGDSREQVDELVNDLGRGDLQAGFHDLEVFTDDASAGSAMDVETFFEELKARLAYSYFERYLAVVFWFMVAGAPLALLYRLSVLYRKNAQLISCQADTEGMDDGVKTGQKWLWLLEWLPLKITGMTLALVGHFNAAVQRWSDLLWSGMSSEVSLLAIVNAALDGLSANDSSEKSTLESSALEAVTLETDSETAGEDEHLGASASQVVRGVEALFFNAIVCWLVVIAVVVILA